jgi:TfoX/Sxy family transcriptional regulator of competence genes
MTEAGKAAFLKLVPSDPAVTTRPMFGNTAAFVNGNMFAGLFGDGLFVRLAPEDLEKVKKQGGRNFEVMPGRAMEGYAMLAPGWQGKSGSRDLVKKAMDFTKKTVPAKAAKAKAKR